MSEDVLSSIHPAASSASQQEKRVDDSAPKNAAKNADEWLTCDRDYAETVSQINASNVARMGLAWSWETESREGESLEATPLVSNGVIYGILTWNMFFAIDARTGKFKWKWDPEVPRQHVLDICSEPVNRGVALYHGKGRSSIPSWRWPRKRGPAGGGKWAAAERRGTRSLRSWRRHSTECSNTDDQSPHGSTNDIVLGFTR
jgi:glucose dehydrogenase